MMLVSPQQIVDIYCCPFIRAATFSPFINAAMFEYDIVTPARIRAFLAQIGHESARLGYVREMWGPTSAQMRYEGRADLGNTEPGDGRRYLGRGLIQITGRANYQAASDALGQDFITSPAMLEQPQWASMSAAWFWHSRGLNELADADKFDRTTYRINGGQTGRADRVALHRAAQAVIV